MALLDHFHPPLSERRHWHAFHPVEFQAAYERTCREQRVLPAA